jgi:hypothetical protein
MDYEEFLASKQKLVQFESVPESEMPNDLACMRSAHLPQLNVISQLSMSRIMPS